MSVSDKDRAFAREGARRLYEFKMAHGGMPSHRSIDIPFEETWRRGLLCECAMANAFGGRLTVNVDPLLHGDGGRDFRAIFWIDEERFPIVINVKCKSVRTSWEALRRSKGGTHVRVPINEINSSTIYVFGIYLERSDDAEVLRWCWGKSLLEKNEKRTLDRGSGKSYFLDFEAMRPLGQLQEMFDQEYKGWSDTFSAAKFLRSRKSSSTASASNRSAGSC